MAGTPDGPPRGFHGRVEHHKDGADGAIDLLVLTESSKSLLYRVQYWQATAAMIAVKQNSSRMEN